MLLVGAAVANSALEQVNQELLRSERVLTDPNGLPGRPWYKHQLYAPGFYTGYGVKTLPGIREAIEERRWEEGDRYIAVVSHAINAYSKRLDRAIAVP